MSKPRRPRLNRSELLDALAAFRDLQSTALVIHVSRSTTVVAYDHAQFDRLVELLEDDSDLEPSVPSYAQVGYHQEQAIWADNADREGGDVLDERHDADDPEPSLASTAREDATGSYAAWSGLVDGEPAFASTAAEDRTGRYAREAEDEREDTMDEETRPARSAEIGMPNPVLGPVKFVDTTEYRRL